LARAPLEGMRIEEIGSRSEIFAQSHVMVLRRQVGDFSLCSCLFLEIRFLTTPRVTGICEE
jgi:hypothetical protein